MLGPLSGCADAPQGTGARIVGFEKAVRRAIVCLLYRAEAGFVVRSPGRGAESVPHRAGCAPFLARCADASLMPLCGGWLLGCLAGFQRRAGKHRGVRARGSSVAIAHRAMSYRASVPRACWPATARVGHRGTRLCRRAGASQRTRTRIAVLRWDGFAEQLVSCRARLALSRFAERSSRRATSSGKDLPRPILHAKDQRHPEHCSVPCSSSQTCSGALACRDRGPKCAVRLPWCSSVHCCVRRRPARS